MSLVRAGKSTILSWGGLTPGAFSYLLPEIFSTEPKFCALLLCPDTETAERWHRDLLYFSPFRSPKWANTDLLYLPGWEQSPYRQLRPSVSARVERIRIFETLRR